MKEGATTLFEDWKVDEKRRGAMSRNHIMFGEISARYYKALGGIKPDPGNPRFKNVLLEPHFVKGLDQFEAKYNSSHGEIVSSWKRTGNKVSYNLTIPANSSATLRLKGENISGAGTVETQEGNTYKYQLLSGNYTIIVEE